MQNRQMVNAGINTESFITGYRRGHQLQDKPIKHIKIEDETIIDAIYTCGVVLGRGSFGVVYEVKESKSQKSWAMKIVNKQTLSPIHIKYLEREIQILKLLKHPHIIHLEAVYESSKKFFIILEKCDGDLMVSIKQGKVFPEHDARRIIQDLNSAVTYLHKNDIVHRDIKLENILLTINPNDANDKLYIKLTDFGLSIIRAGREYTDMLHDRCGTIYYMAPEILTSQSYSQQCDIWAMGVIVYVLLTGKLPFCSKTETETVADICNKEPNLTSLQVSVECKDLIAKTLNKNPALRLTATEIGSHPWLMGKPIKNDVYSNNIIELMRLWNDGVNDSSNSLKAVDKGAAKKEITKQTRRQSVSVSIQNIEFDKSSKRSNKSTPERTNTAVSQRTGTAAGARPATLTEKR